MTKLRSVVLGCGSALPEKILTNHDLEKIVDTTDEWIVERTGIKQRHVTKDTDVKTSDLATEAAKKAIAQAGIRVEDIDFIVLATGLPDLSFPATATTVQANLGMERGFAFDVSAVCAGFIYALSVADKFLISGQYKTGLVIGSETPSKVLDWTDRTTCVLFGDGAGAFVLQAQEAKGDTSDRGILSTHLHADGRYRDILRTDGGPSATQTLGKIQMNGKEVFRHAVEKLSAAVEETLAYNNITPEEIDWLTPHQANYRIIDAMRRKLDLPEEQVVITVHKHGNTSSASIPLAVDEAVRDGRIQKGHLLLMEAIGGGLAWGSCLLRW